MTECEICKKRQEDKVKSALTKLGFSELYDKPDWYQAGSNYINITLLRQLLTEVKDF